MDQTVLKVCDLCKTYPSFRLEKVSFSVKRGEIVGLIGRNGAGKSTTLKSLIRLISSEGRIEYFGLPLSGNEKRIKQKIGYVGGGFDFYALNTAKKVAANVARFYENWQESEFHRYCERFALDPEKKISSFSEGMKVKFSVALALSHRAELLIMDEPTSGLDPYSREEFCDILLSLVKENEISVLFSTHITADLMRVADRVVYLSRGKVLLDRGRKELMEEYRVLRFQTEEEAKSCRNILGEKETKDGWEGLISKKDLPQGIDAEKADLDQIMIHLEKEQEK